MAQFTEKAYRKMQRMAWLTFAKHLNPVDTSIIKIKNLLIKSIC